MTTSHEPSPEQMSGTVVWAWYATCLPMDRTTLPTSTMPKRIRRFMSSPAMAQHLLNHFDEALAPLRQFLHSHAQRVHAVHQRSAGTELDMTEGDFESFGFLLDFGARMLQRPHLLDEMRAKLQVQAPWMWARFTPMEQRFITGMADWYAKQR
jgi:hypothetical protein